MTNILSVNLTKVSVTLVEKSFDMGKTRGEERLILVRVEAVPSRGIA